MQTLPSVHENPLADKHAACCTAAPGLGLQPSSWGESLPAPQRLGLLASQSQGPAARPIWAHSFGNEGLVHHSYDVNAATESPSELALTNRHDEKGIKSKADLQKCCAARPHRHNHMAQDSVPLSCRRDFSWSARRSLAGGRSFARGGPAPAPPDWHRS